MPDLSLPNAQTYSFSETCQILRVSKRTLNKLIRSNRIKFLQIEKNGKRYFTSSSILDFTESIGQYDRPKNEPKNQKDSGFLKCLLDFMPKV